MRSAAQDAFDMECDPVTGAAWPPLNEAYKKQRYADRYTGKTLNRTGDMRRSLSVRCGGCFPWWASTPPMPPRTSSARVPGPTSSAPAPKGPELLRPQRGKAGPQGRAPPRQRHPPAPFLGVGEDHKAEMRRSIVRHLRKAVRGA